MNSGMNSGMRILNSGIEGGNSVGMYDCSVGRREDSSYNIHMKQD